MSTIERVMGRAIEDVREFVTDKLDDYIDNNSHSEYEEDMLDVATATLIVHNLSASQMLTKEQAKWLKEFLESQYRFIVEQEINSTNFLSEMDNQSIFIDAWGLYCRPGTYSIDINMD